KGNVSPLVLIIDAGPWAPRRQITPRVFVRNSAPPPTISKAADPAGFPTVRLAWRQAYRSAAPDGGTPSFAKPFLPISCKTNCKPGRIISNKGVSSLVSGSLLADGGPSVNFTSSLTGR